MLVAAGGLIGTLHLSTKIQSDEQSHARDLMQKSVMLVRKASGSSSLACYQAVCLQSLFEDVAGHASDCATSIFMASSISFNRRLRLECHLVLASNISCLSASLPLLALIAQ